MEKVVRDSDYEEELLGRKLTEKEREEQKKALLSMLPTHCAAFSGVDIKNKPKRGPSIARIMEPKVCFKSCPKIIPRREWGAVEPRIPPGHMLYRARPAVFKDVECSGCTTERECLYTIQTLQMYQMEYLNFRDIAYSFLIDEKGNIYEGRGWGVENEKFEGFYGIAYIREHNAKNEFVRPPTDEMVQATHDLVMCGIQKGFVSDPFYTNAFVGDTPVERMRDYIEDEEDVDYKTRVEDYGIHY